jgi:hypothetical protein
MSVNAMHPTFTDRDGYVAWRKQWKSLYVILVAQIIAHKEKAKLAQAAKDPEAPSIQSKLATKRAMAHKMMSQLAEAKQRRDRILAMHKQLAEQEALFPMTLSNCRSIDFHFNKGSLEYPFLPKWVVKAQGKSFYVSHFTSTVGFETVERDEGTTRGLLRMRHADLIIEKGGLARIERPVALEQAA